ncbi:MAG TPA: methyltransferase domain-containing protein [Tepidisphaeraceae bacterium]|nr:methyltransferase domain-containing protein [Tepidisphaeraceae bacterium]
MSNGLHQPPWLAHRQREAEWMDEDEVDPRELRRSLRFIRWVNRLFGYTWATLSHLERFSARWKQGERIEILDVATGSADVPLAIVRWGERRGFDVRVVGVDLHAKTVEAARQATAQEPRIRIVQADALCLPFDHDSFDYTVCSMFLHHLSDDEAVVVLRAMGGLARRGVIAADLLRHRRAFAWIWLLTLAANPIVRHDALVSIRQAFSKPEVLGLRQHAGLGFADYHRHFAHRFVLAGEKASFSTVAD